MTKGWRVWLVVAGALVAVAVGFGSRRWASHNSPEAVARRQWEAAGIRDYTWTVDVGCFCPPGEVTTVVRDGKIVNVTYGGDKAKSAAERHGLTVEDVFNAMNGGDTSQLSFDPLDGHPLLVSVVVPGAEDADITYTVKSFTRP